MESRDSRLEDALSAYFEALERGETPDVRAIAGNDDDLAQRLQSLVLRDALAAAAMGSESDPGSSRRLADYRLFEIIGRGGMGKVHRAERVSDGTPAAVKLVELEDTEHAAVRFRREAEIAAALRHPNIVSILGVGQEDGQGYIAMQLLEGPPLDTVEVPLAPERVARIGVEVARALDEAHRVGIIHRDVKPGNVILDGDRPVLVDFGLSRAARHSTVTRSGTRPGTLAYLPPECLREPAPRPHVSMDVYSLGATLYELLAGRPPFDGEDASDLIRRIALEDPAPIGTIPRDLDTVVLRAMEKRPADRFSSAQALADELERFLEDRPVHTRRPGVVARTLRRVRRHRTAAVLAVALVMTVALWVAATVVESWSDQRVLQARADALEEAIIQRDLVRARLLREALGHESGAAESLAPLFLRVDGLEALEKVLDLILDRPADQDRGSLLRWTNRLVRHGGLEHAPREARLALALARYALGDKQGAHQWLDRVEQGPWGRDGVTVVLRAAIEERRNVVIPALKDAGTVDHILAAVGYRWLWRNEDEEREIAAALRQEDLSYRALYLKALLRFRQRRVDAAWNILSALGRPGRIHSSRRTYVAWIALMRGDLDAAERQLDTIPTDQQTARARLLEIDLVERRTGDAVAAWRLARGVVASHPKEAQVLLYVSGLAARLGRLDAAASLLDRTEPLVVSAHQKTSVRLRRIALQLAELSGTGLGLAVDQVTKRLDELSNELELIAESAAHPQLVARGRAGLAEALEIRGRLEEDDDGFDAAFRQFRLAVRAAPRLLDLKVRLARFILNHERRSSFGLARRLLDEVLAAPHSGHTSLSREEVDMARALRRAVDG